MGAIIIGTGISTGAEVNSSNSHAALAGKMAIAQAAINPWEVDVIINVGIYRDENMAEPAMSAFIQKELAINLDYLKSDPPRQAAFSFDLMNGGIGALDALQVADAMLQSNSAKHVLIVASDSHPSRKKARDFPFAALGSAILLKKGEDSARGLFTTRQSTRLLESYGRMSFVKSNEMGASGRSHMEIQTAPDFVEAITQFSLETIASFVQDMRLDLNQCHLIPSQISEAYVNAINNRFKPSSISNLVGMHGGDTHSSTFGLGLHALARAGELNKGQRIVMAGATSGLTMTCALYVA